MKKSISIALVLLILFASISLVWAGNPRRELVQSSQEIKFRGTALYPIPGLGSDGWYVLVEQVISGPSISGVILAGKYVIPDCVGYLDPEIKPGDKVEVYGLYDSGPPEYVSICESEDYYIIKVGECPAEVALQGESGESDLNTLRRLRGEVLAESPIGRRYIDLYYKHSTEVVKMLLLDPELRSRTREMLEKCMPAIRALLDEGTGEELFLTEDMIEQIDDVLDDFAKKASPGLRAVIRTTKGQLKGFKGETFKEIRSLIMSTEAEHPR